MDNNPRIIELPKFLDQRGNLSFVQNNTQIPFEIQRTYWIYDVPGGEDRGGHAYKTTDEFIIAIAGAFDVTIDDGKQKKTFSLNRSMVSIFQKVFGARWRTSLLHHLHSNLQIPNIIATITLMITISIFL